MANDETDEQFIARLEASGDLDPSCPSCQTHFYPRYRSGKRDVFAPRHKASARCESGKYPHCTCDTCF